MWTGSALTEPALPRLFLRVSLLQHTLLHHHDLHISGSHQLLQHPTGPPIPLHPATTQPLASFFGGSCTNHEARWPHLLHIPQLRSTIKPPDPRSRFLAHDSDPSPSSQGSTIGAHVATIPVDPASCRPHASSPCIVSMFHAMEGLELGSWLTREKRGRKMGLFIWAVFLI